MQVEQTFNADETVSQINVEEFLDFVFLNNKNQLLSYYKQMGYLAIDSEKYYKKRIRLKNITKS